MLKNSVPMAPQLTMELMEGDCAGLGLECFELISRQPTRDTMHVTAAWSIANTVEK